MSLTAFIASKTPRHVKRVLLMVDFVDQSEGDVYDLTELVAEMFQRAKHGARISVDLQADYGYDYSKGGNGRYMKPVEITFGGDAGEWVSGATHIEDVVNSSLPDGFKVEALKKKARRLMDKAEHLKRDAMYAKLMQVAEVRHQHPIAKFTLNPDAIEQRNLP